MSEQNKDLQDNPTESLQEQKKDYKVYDSVDSLPFKITDLFAEARQYFTPARDHSQQYIVFENEGKPVGFSILDIPNIPNSTCQFSYRYVFTEARQQGVGKKLRIATYEHAKELGFQWVSSGINNVLKLNADQTVSEHFAKGYDGTWASYKSMHSASYSDGTFPIHEIEFASMDPDDNSIDLTFRTNVQERSQNPTLPLDPEDLFKILQRDVFPPNYTPRTLMYDAEFKPDIFAYKDKRTLNFNEFKTELNIVYRN